jgi:radical SAM superfamily enzyme YgiQ (UPF0313 family)
VKTPLSISFLSISIPNSEWALPLASGNLKAYVDQYSRKHKLGWKTRILDYNLDTPEDLILERVFEDEVPIVAITVYLWNRKRMESLCRAIRQQRPEAIILAGGPEMERPGELKSLLDWTLSGEGEVGLVQILEALGKFDFPAQRPGRDFFTSTDTLRTQRQICPLEDLPSPYLSGTIDLESRNSALWELSRGCPYRCSFCYESRGVGGVRYFPRERLERELDLFVEKGIHQIFVLDPTFNARKDRAKEILLMLALKAPEIHFTLELRTEQIDEELAELLSRIHCSVQIGLQSANPKALESVNRKLDPQDYSEKISLLHQSGVSYGLDLIYGLPRDSYSEFLSSLDYALSLQPNHLDIFPLAVLPGTKLKDTADSYSLVYSRETPYLVSSSPDFSLSEMEKARGIAEAVELFYNRGRAVSWLWLLGEWTDTPLSSILEDFAEFSDEHGEATRKTSDYGSLEILGLQKTFVKQILPQRPATLFGDIISIFTSLGILREEEVGIPEVEYHYPPEKLLSFLDQGIFESEDLFDLLSDFGEDPQLYRLEETGAFVPLDRD